MKNSVRAAALALLLFLATRAAATKVQWNATGDYVNFPFGSPSPPFVLRTTEGSAPDQIVLVTNKTETGWELTAYTADAGEPASSLPPDPGTVAWQSVVEAPDAQNAALMQLTTGVPASQQLNNTLSMLFLQLGKYVVAVDGATGAKLWQHATYNASTPKITGYSGGGGPARVYLTSSFLDMSRAVPTQVNYIEALDPATGQLKWANFTAPPPASGLPMSDTAALWGVTPAPGLAVFAQGSRMYGLSAEDGRQLWGMVVSTGAGTGMNPNVTSVTLVEAAPDLPGGRPYPLLLLQSSTWEQTRFMAYVLNGTNATTPPAVAWQMKSNTDIEGTLNDRLVPLGLGRPQPSPSDGVFLFWSNRTSYDSTNGGKPVYNSVLVGRSLAGGTTVWAKNAATELGLGKLPVSPPLVHVGVAAVVTGNALVVLDAGSGGLRYAVDEAPYKPLSAGGQYSYMPVTTFVNDWGHLVAVRCLGSEQPGSICAYNGYKRAAEPKNAAERPGKHAATVAAAVAASIALALAL